MKVPPVADPTRMPRWWRPWRLVQDLGDGPVVLWSFWSRSKAQAEALDTRIMVAANGMTPNVWVERR